MTSAARLLAAVLALAIASGCASGAAPRASAGPAGSSSSGAPSGGLGGSGCSVDTPDEAAELVIASDSRFVKVGKKDPDLIGQCCWYEAAPGQEGFRVQITMGWGDCPAGCINSHVWTYEVSRGGEIQLIGQSGDAVPPGGIPNT
jgi:hypothetical protein